MRRLPAAVLGVIGVGVLAAALAGAVPAQAEGPVPKRITSGWLPYWMTSPARPQGVQSAVENADLFTEVSPFWYSATAAAGGGVKVGLNANFTNGASNVAWSMQQLKGAGLTVVPSIADGSGKGRMASVLADPAKRAAHIADLVTLVTSNGFDGIDLDYEGFAFTDGSASWAATQPNWTAFVTELAAALHAQGRILSVTIPPPCTTASVCGPRSGYWVYDIAGIAPAADRIRIMAYDYSVQGIGPIAPMPWVRAIVQYAVTVADPAKVQIGVPTYGRAWTKKSASGYRLAGTCPASGTPAYKSLTSMASVTARDIPATLAAAGVTPDQVQWDQARQENWVEFDKQVTWTDASGTSQTCTAKRIMWWVGPEGVLARTQLVGEFGLGAAAQWTIGGDDPAQWPLVRAYAQSLAPAATEVSAVGAPVLVFGSPMTVSATAVASGAPVADVPLVLQFRPAAGAGAGAKKRRWTDVQTVASGPDGVATFTIVPDRTGDWQVVAPAGVARAEGASIAFTTQVQALVTATPKDPRVRRGADVVVKAWARPARPGQSLVLQVQRGDRWKSVVTERADSRGRARLAAPAPAGKGRYVYRVIALERRGILTNVSTDIPIRVTR